MEEEDFDIGALLGGSIRAIQEAQIEAIFGRQESAFYTSGRNLDHGVIDPRDTRRVLGFAGLMFEGINGVGLEARVGTFIPATKLAADKRSQGQKADVEVYQAVENEFGKDIKLAFSQMGIGAAKLEWTDTPSDDTLLVDVAAMSADGAELALELAGGSSETMETLA